MLSLLAFAERIRRSRRVELKRRLLPCRLPLDHSNPEFLAHVPLVAFRIGRGIGTTVTIATLAIVPHTDPGA